MNPVPPISSKERSARRILLQIPNFNEFADLLHERLHTILFYYEEWAGKFMLLTNLYDRDPERIANRREQNPEDLEALLYCGTDRQRLILEKDAPDLYQIALLKKGITWDKDQWQKDRNPNWQALRNRIMDRSMEDVQTFPYFDNFRKGELEFADVKVLELKEYFAEIQNEFQENEKPIMADYFDLDRDKYIGIPLLGMGLFQGIVWIVFKDAESDKLDEKTIRRIIKYFQVEYDNLVLDWGFIGENIKKEIKVKEALENVVPNNPIQSDIRLDKYYEISDYYHQEQIRQAEAVFKLLKTQYAKTATITTLLDSYAHNISAHSLTSLSWWFRERAEYLDENFGGRKVIETLGRDNNPLIRHYKESRRPDLKHKTYRTLSRELAPLFKFLLEKGAFWSGITRQTNFTGKISSLYSILWYDFVNNPLYLGTIANTEKVRKLFIDITIYSEEKELSDLPFRNIKLVKKNKQGTFLSGKFACINLANFDVEKAEAKESVFVERGPLYEVLSEELKTMKAFFPGGVVGKHAFFTLIENEIRNVKHFRGEDLKEIQDKGLTLNISIHTRPVDTENTSTTKPHEFIKIGVWLGHLVEIDTELLLSRIENLDKDIITEDSFQPRLGGNQQDKLCAAMLLNKTFDKAQDKDSPLGKIYYPWIKSVRADYNHSAEKREEFEVSRRRYVQMPKEQFIAAFEPISGLGYLKKYFHLWRGDDIEKIDQFVDFQLPQLENYSRFRFIQLEGPARIQKVEYQRQGVIRILTDINTPKNQEDAYRMWLAKWLKKGEEPVDTVIDFVEGTTNSARISYTRGKVQFENADGIRDHFFDESKEKAYQAIPNRITIPVEHGSNLTAASNKLNIRSHGELVRRFGKGRFPSQMINLPKADALELVEAFATRICLFDRRIHNRLVDPESIQESLQKDRLKLLNKSLNINIKDESYKLWKKVREKGFQRFHFLVIHLSFIEGIKDANGIKYSEERIIDFIDEQILKGASPQSVGDNFILVITTGRGRMAWWDKITEFPNYSRFTTFRPIESILGAVEDAMQMPDDIDLKYNLVKLLFGS